MKEIRHLLQENLWDYENGFYWFSSPARMNKLLAQYELYKKIIKLPGEVFELGVYKAASLVRLATFRNLLENDLSRKIVGFDSFNEFPTTNLSAESDYHFVDQFVQEGGNPLSLDEVERILAEKKFSNIDLVAGDVFETIPAYLSQFPSTRICFLHLDMDTREPTMFALEQLWDLVVPNGVLVVDDYGAVAGATDAVDEFCRTKNLQIEKLGNYKVPSYVRKVLD